MFSLRAWAFLFLTSIAWGISCDVNAANTQVEFGRGPGNPGTVCIYDYSAARLCDPMFTVNDTTGIVTWTGAGGGGGGGSVTSVALTVPSILAVAGSPISTSGTFALSLTTETLNTVFAGPPSAGPSVPTFRALVAADIPTLPFTQLSGSAICAQLPALTGAITTTAGSCATAMATLPVSGGGTGATTLSSGLPLFGAGTSPITTGTLTGNTTKLLTFSGAATAANCLHTDASGNAVVTGSDCGAGGGGSGVVNSGTINQLAYYAAAGTTVSGETFLQCSNHPALTGDITSSSGSCATTLPTVDSTSGTYGTTPGQIPGFTVNAKGQITASSQQGIAFSNITGVLACAQAPAGTGDVTSGAGSCANTLVAISGKAVSGASGTAGGLVVLQAAATLSAPTINQPLIFGDTSSATNAATGQVGEVLKVSNTAVSLSNGVVANQASLSVTAGHWLCSANAAGLMSAGTMTSQIATLSTTSGVLGGWPAYTQNGGTVISGATDTAVVPPQLFNFTVNTTLFLVVDINASGGSLTGDGYIVCQRIW